MTLQYIKHLNIYLKRAKSLKSNPNRASICSFDREVRAFCGRDYISVKLTSVFSKDWGVSCSITEMQTDLDSIIAALNSKISETPKSIEILNVLNDIEDIEAIIPTDLDNRFQFISKIYHSYCSVIEFDDGIKNATRYADGSGLSAGEYSEATPSMLKGLQLVLERYAETLCENKQSESPKTPFIQVTNSPTISATATNNINIDIAVEIENAIKRVEDACLPDEQEKEVLDKIQELKGIVESKDSKKSKWAKLKDFFKWVAEQGIQVAGIIVPLIAATIK